MAGGKETPKTKDDWDDVPRAHCTLSFERNQDRIGKIYLYQSKS